MMWFGASPAKDPDTKTRKSGGGNLTPPPPDKPKDWRALGVLQYREHENALEFRLVSQSDIGTLADELKYKHSIDCINWSHK